MSLERLLKTEMLKIKPIKNSEHSIHGLSEFRIIVVRKKSHKRYEYTFINIINNVILFFYLTLCTNDVSA